MNPTTYQIPEIRDSNDNIIQQGAFGKNTALSNATNDGWIDYVVNNLEALKATADKVKDVDITETPASSTSYTSSVPSDKVFADFNSIGGKTIVWNQILPNGNFASTSGWVTSNCSLSVNNNKASITVTANGNAYISQDVPYVHSHKFYISGSIKCNTTAIITLTMYGVDTVIDSVNYPVTGVQTQALRQRRIIQGSSPTNNNIRIFFSTNPAATAGDTAEVSDLFVIDLTLMFGAGNEPSTVAEFEAMFPASYYPYNAGTLLSASVDKVISKDSSNNIKTVMPISSAIQSLDGYGWSAGSVYNYVDFARKKFVKRVGSRAYASGDDSDSTVITDGTTTYYALTTPIEIDISSILGATGITCETGGSLTFSNSNGNNYKLPVPVSLDWLDGTDGLMTMQDKAILDNVAKKAEVDYVPSAIYYPDIKPDIGANLKNNWNTNGQCKYVETKNYIIVNLNVSGGTNTSGTVIVDGLPKLGFPRVFLGAYINSGTVQGSLRYKTDGSIAVEVAGTNADIKTQFVVIKTDGEGTI